MQSVDRAGVRKGGPLRTERRGGVFILGVGVGRVKLQKVEIKTAER